MERILLYYPSINIPNSNWLRSSLFYTHKLATIFPFDSIDHKRVNDETRILYDEELYKPIFVLNELNSSYKELENSENNFLNAVRSQDFKKIQSLAKQANTHIGFTDNEMSQNTFDMYISKLTYKVADYLRENGDILISGNVYDKVDVRIEKTSAIVYMSMLADYLACVNKDLVIPSTDEHEFEKLAFQLADDKVLTHRIQLNNCLQTPSSGVSIRDIIKFKKKSKQELLQFRTELDKIEDEINSAIDDTSRKRKLMQFQETVQRELIEIKRLLGDSKLEYVLNGFSSLLDFKQKDYYAQQAGILTQ